ncbi:MAG: tRNA (adenosine(37)-N6)-threonylcarbamoyltransferase complex dimerization subunit type 1 TsaB [Ruminococcus sp.]
MLILGIDTSGKTASAALFDTESGIFPAQDTLYTQKTHSQVIMPMCRKIIEQTGHKMTDLGMIAVANGPGSYTGLRIGVAAVKAMCYALDIRCCGVSTLKGLAWNNIGYLGKICAVMKARGELVYTCTYRNLPTGSEPLCDEQIIDSSELANFLNCDNEPVLLCGDGAEEFFRKYCLGTTSESKFRLAPAMGMLQNAAGICLASLYGTPIEPQELEVSYLQKVKAEKELEDKNKNK